MAEVEVDDGRPPHPAIGAAAAADNNDQQNVVSTGETSESDNEDMFSATDDDENIDDDDAKGKACRTSSALESDRDADGESNRTTSNRNNNQDGDLLLFYDENLDQEDEAYVYKNMRGGISDNVNVNFRISSSGTRSVENRNYGNNDSTCSAGESLASKSDTEIAAKDRLQQQQQQQQTIQVLRPRHSDAVLSCPCCFNIVCMDCQKHKRYANQYRAMFVMGVVVDWQHILVYDEQQRGLVSKIEERTIGEEQDDDDVAREEEWLEGGGEAHQGSTAVLRAKDGEYYAVECAACRTQVAALDMSDEVYYFHGCLESSSAF